MVFFFPSSLQRELFILSFSLLQNKQYKWFPCHSLAILFHFHLYFFSSIHSQNFQTKAFSFGKHRYNFFSFRSLRIFHFAWGETLTHSLLHVVFRIFGRYTNEYSIHMGYQKKIETIVLRQSNGKMKRDGMHLIRWLACWIFNISMFGKTMCINDNRTLKHTVYISTILWNIQCRCVMLNFILNVLQSILNVAPRTK